METFSPTVTAASKRRHSFTRQQLYDLVWAKPMRTLAAELGISDRGLAKACAAADIPVPARGYWNKLQAGQAVIKIQLPARGLGKPDDVSIGGERWRYYAAASDYLNMPIPPAPVFAVTMEEVQDKATALVNKAPLPKNIATPHRAIAKLLEADEVRRQKQQASPYPSPWDAPIFDSTFERRRLKLLNGLFTCLQHCGMAPSVQGKEGRELHIHVGEQSVSVTLDSMQAGKHSNGKRRDIHSRLGGMPTK